MDKNITDTNERFYTLEDSTQISTKAVLVLGLDKYYRGYMGSGSDIYVADRGVKIPYNEILVYFPYMKRKEYYFK